MELPISLPSFLALCCVLFLSLAFLFIRRKKPINGVVKEIWVYPIKSAKGIQLSSAEFTETGFLYDRLFMITNKDNRFISQRTHPKLALLETSLTKSGYLTLRTPTKESPIHIPLVEPATPYEVHSVSVWGDTCEGIDMGDGAAAFINKFLGTSDLRLMRMPDSYQRKTDRSVFLSLLPFT
jgi:uncharacterized protein